VTGPGRPLRVLLVGMMGCGKTTVGRVLADRTRWPYVDNDELVTEVGGAETAELGERGADALHAVELDVVRRILGMPPPLVAGIPGSAVTDDETREAMRRNGTVVWLRARVDTLAERVGDGADRPFFAGRDVTEVLHELYVGRAPVYEAAAHLVVDVDELSPDAIADRILENLDPAPASAGAH
jgi:shikimate kinase